MASIERLTLPTRNQNGRPQVRWRARWRNPDGSSRELRFGTRADAERYLERLGADQQRGEYVDPRLGRTRFRDHLSEWAAGRVHLRSSTKATQDSLLANHVIPALGHLEIASIEPSRVQALISAMRASGYSPSTIRAVHALLLAALEAAVDNRLISRNPAAHIDLPSLEYADKRFLTPVDIAGLADAISPRWRAMVFVAAYTGLRWGEVAALRTGSVNLLSRTLEVSATLNEVRGKIVMGPPKTRRSRRRLSLPRFLCDELEHHLATFGVGQESLIFTNTEGGPLRRNAWRRRVWKPGVDASVGEPMTFHDLRHSHAAILIKQGVHPKVIQERLGHASIRTTLDTYGHLFEGLDEAAAEALDSAARGVSVGFGAATA